MKFCLFISPYVITLILLVNLPGHVCGYDSPNFDEPPFSRDGVFMEESDRESLLEALAAIASNFPSHPKVDDDLREKAVAIALTLEPLHYSSRMAHQKLQAERTVQPIPYFDSLSRVAEALWSNATRLLTPPAELDSIKLSRFLMELSLLTHPDPPMERLQFFGREVGNRPLPWGKFVSLDASQNPSTRQLELLRKEISSVANKTEGSSIFNTNPGTPSGSEADPQPESSLAGQSIDPFTSSLKIIRGARDDSEFPVTGALSVTLRPAADTPEEQDLIKQASSPNGSLFIPLLIPSEFSGLKGPNFSKSSVEEFGLPWPGGAVAELGLELDLPDEGDVLNYQMVAGIPTYPLLHSALHKTPINDEFAFAGDLIGANRELPLSIRILAFAEAASQMDGTSYLLLPQSVREKLLEEIQTNLQLDALFKIELITYGGRKIAIDLLNRPTPPEWIQASQEFAEIYAVSERMSLVDLAANAKVQERLQTILDRVPNHLSAWVMLEFGKSAASRTSGPNPANATAITSMSLLMEPYAQLKEESPDINALRQGISATRRGLSEIRPDLPVSLRALFASAEDALRTCEDYLALSNRNTSNAEQKLEEVENALADFERELSAVSSSSP
ncbi:MAG: hypothetical protein AAGA96_06395 [Verrucomicrobiota bacterium]